jgi:hypothetical protein
MAIVLIALTLGTLRRAHIRVEYSVSWLAGSLVLLGLSLSPGALVALSDILDLRSPPLALTLAVGGVFVIIFFRFSVIISKLRDDNVALAQRVAALEYYRRHPDGGGAVT